MPTFPTRTSASQQVWASPDGQRVIYQVTLDYQGQTFQAKTYSKEIAQVGWAGTVESYEKPNARGGNETFVKQPQKEGFAGGGGGGYSKGGGGKPMADPFTMYLSYAKDLAVAMIDKGVLDESKFGAVLDAVLTGGKTLYDGRPGAEPAQPIQPDMNTPIDTTNIDQIFGFDQSPPPQPPQGETPWQRS